MLWILPLWLVAAGALVWALGRRVSRGALGTVAVTVAATGVAGSVMAAVTRPGAAWRWGADLVLRLGVDTTSAAMAVLVAGVALPIVVWAAAHEERDGLGRLLGVLLAFVGAMLLLVLAQDLLTLLIGFELTAALSWAVIAHHHRSPVAVRAASEAFVVTRVAGVALLGAAGAAWAGGSDLNFATLHDLNTAPRAWLAAALLLAAAAKSAQVPFSSWLFAAMEGPTAASALLHSATMVAAGAWALIRLAPVLEPVPWFGPAAISLGLVTAVTGGVVASAQTHSKKLLAASTSAHYGLMIAAVGAGAAGAAMGHLVGHAVTKALLFLAAGIAIAATGSAQLADHRLGRLRSTAVMAAIGAASLAAIPPLVGAWSKEQVVAGLGHKHAALAVVGIVAGALSAFYAGRWALASFGRAPQDDVRSLQTPSRPERAALAALAAAAVVGGVAWVMPTATTETLLGLPLEHPKAWELALSLGLVAIAVYAVRAFDRRGRLVTLTSAPRARAAAAAWLGLPVAGRVLVVDPILRLARGAAAVDQRVVDAGTELAAGLVARLAGMWDRLADASVDDLVHLIAGGTQRSASLSASADERGVDGLVDGVAFGVGIAGRDARRTHTGLLHHALTWAVLGLAAASLLLVFSR